MKVLYIPVRLIAHLLGGIVGKKANTRIWAMISDKPKSPTNADGQTLLQVAGGAALEAGILAATAGVADQLAARLFHRMMGAWPAQADDDAKKEAKAEAKKEAKANRKSESKSKTKAKAKRTAKRHSAAEPELRPTN